MCFHTWVQSGPAGGKGRSPAQGLQGPPLPPCSLGLACLDSALSCTVFSWALLYLLSWGGGGGPAPNSQGSFSLSLHPCCHLGCSEHFPRLLPSILGLTRGQSEPASQRAASTGQTSHSLLLSWALKNSPHRLHS